MLRRDFLRNALAAAAYALAPFAGKAAAETPGTYRDVWPNQPAIRYGIGPNGAPRVSGDGGRTWIPAANTLFAVPVTCDLYPHPTPHNGIAYYTPEGELRLYQVDVPVLIPQGCWSIDGGKTWRVFPNGR